MIRTQISLSAEEYRRAKLQARKLKISLAELLRRTLREAISVDERKPWMKYRGLVESGRACSSQEIDDIVYGDKD